jgi:hypothetical protein
MLLLNKTSIVQSICLFLVGFSIWQCSLLGKRHRSFTAGLLSENKTNEHMLPPQDVKQRTDGPHDSGHTKKFQSKNDV